MGRFGGKGANARALTNPEIGLIRRVFKTARIPSLLEVTIADGVNFNGGAWTDSDYEINVGPRLFNGDLANLEPSTLVHEMTHVWQYYNHTLTKAHGFGAHLRASLGGFEDDLYAYDLDGSWNDMGFEGQAQMVEDWYDMGMKEEGYRYFFMKHVLYSGNLAARRLTRAQLALMEPEIGIQETISIADRASARQDSVPLSDSYLISLLQRRYAADDVAGFGARARQVEQAFRSATLAQALPLITRLLLRKPGDKVSMYFHDHLSTPTRTKLLQILQNRAAGK
jgi:hypothetical protein